MIAFDNSYARLPDRFYKRVHPAKVRAPSLIKVNEGLAKELGLDPKDLTAEVVAGNVVPEGADPIALAYAGHQFGNFVPQLGDGRAVLMGEVVAANGARYDLQWKGSGRTPFSRGGDGRAALGPVLREYIVSEAMAALGVPTTRTLAAALTGDAVAREEMLPGAVLIRVAASHLRIGTFELFANREDGDAVQSLVAYALSRHFPKVTVEGSPALTLLKQVIDAQAALVARWLGIGFIHGVMNTDNTTISGETIDYGPCAFLDAYEPRKHFSSIDRAGRYAFANQPKIVQWNLARLAETLLPLLGDSEEQQVETATVELSRFVDVFEARKTEMFRTKLGLFTADDGDRALAEDLLERMASGGVDYTNFFRRLSNGSADVASMFEQPGAFHDWEARWSARCSKEDVPAEQRAAAMRAANPAFIPRNHRVEEAIAAAAINSDFAPFERLVSVLSKPYEEQPEHAALADAPGPEFQQGYRTFCGT
ncbi:MAG: YdiU family protein [Labilithrix sp.]